MNQRLYKYMYVSSYSSLSVHVHKIRKLNFYHDGDATPFGQVQTDVYITRCWETLKERSAYQEWRARVDDFNKCV